MDALPPAALTALVTLAVGSTDGARQRLRARLERHVREQRGAARFLMVEKMRSATSGGSSSAATESLAAWLQAHQVTLQMLLTPPKPGQPPPFQWRELAEDQVLLREPGDLPLLGVRGDWPTLAALAAVGAGPHALRQALGLKKRGELGKLLGLGLVADASASAAAQVQRAWLAHAAAFGPRDLAALGVSLGDWMRSRPALVQEAAAAAAQNRWLAKGEAGDWAKYADLDETLYAAVSGTGSGGGGGRAPARTKPVPIPTTTTTTTTVSNTASLL